MQNASMRGSLKELAKHCRALQELLKNDKDSFEKNDLSVMENSNKQKMDLLEKINLIAHDIRSSGTQITKQKEVEDVVSVLKEEINQCYSYIMMNSNIVDANLSRLRHVWDRLIASHIKYNGIYDQTGTLKG